MLRVAEGGRVVRPREDHTPDAFSYTRLRAHSHGFEAAASAACLKCGFELFAVVNKLLY